MDSCGRGHKKRRKKGARRAFFHRKNYERLRQASTEGNSTTQAIPSEHVELVEIPFVQRSMAGVSFPDDWLASSNNGVTQWSKMGIGPSGVYQPTVTVLLEQNSSWSVHLFGKKVPAACKLLSEFPSKISSPTIISQLISCVNEAKFCPGNVDNRYVDICEKRGGTMKKGGYTIAYVDNTPSTGQDHTRTVRRVECDLLFDPSSDRLRCQACQSLRSTLRSAVHRDLKRDCTSVADSHTNYIHLTPSEQSERMKNLHQSLRSVKRQVKRLDSKVSSLIEKEAILLQPVDATDIEQVVEEVDPLVADKFPENSPQRIFWDQQRMSNQLKDKRQMRWHPLIIRFALNLKYMSSSAYRAVRQGGLISLPSERTLADYTHWISPQSGLQIEYVEKFHSLLTEVLPSHQHQCALSMDEMKVKSGLIFNKHSGNLVGFVDLGSVNSDIEKALSSSENECSSQTLASHAFVLMARAIFKPSLFVPVAHFFSSNLRGNNY